MISRIHVNQHILKRNLKTGERKPTITVKTSKSSKYGHKFHIMGQDGKIAATIIDQTDRPLSCGARIFIETTNEVKPA